MEASSGIFDAVVVPPAARADADAVHSAIASVATRQNLSINAGPDTVGVTRRRPLGVVGRAELVIAQPTELFDGVVIFLEHRLTLLV